MSYQHLGERTIRAVRKPHRCEACGGTIGAKQPAIYAASIQDGDFFGWYSHLECGKAEADWNKQRGEWGLHYDSDDYQWLFEAIDGEPGEQAWLAANHPKAAGHLGISIEGCAVPGRLWGWAP